LDSRQSQKKRLNGINVLVAAGNCCFRLNGLEIVGPEVLSAFIHGHSGDKAFHTEF
jgi:hypothetical protein